MCSLDIWPIATCLYYCLMVIYYCRYRINQPLSIAGRGNGEPLWSPRCHHKVKQFIGNYYLPTWIVYQLFTKISFHSVPLRVRVHLAFELRSILTVMMQCDQQPLTAVFEWSIWSSCRSTCRFKLMEMMS